MGEPGINSTKVTENSIKYEKMNGLAPEYLQRLFAQCYSDYNGRNSGAKLAKIYYLKRSFFYGGTKILNNFPDSLKDFGSIVQSKRNMKKISIISDSHTAVV